MINHDQFTFYPLFPGFFTYDKELGSDQRPSSGSVGRGAPISGIPAGRQRGSPCGGEDHQLWFNRGPKLQPKKIPEMDQHLLYCKVIIESWFQVVSVFSARNQVIWMPGFGGFLLSRSGSCRPAASALDQRLKAGIISWTSNRWQGVSSNMVGKSII